MQHTASPNGTGLNLTKPEFSHSEMRHFRFPPKFKMAAAIQKRKKILRGIISRVSSDQMAARTFPRHCIQSLYCRKGSKCARNCYISTSSEIISIFVLCKNLRWWLKFGKLKIFLTLYLGSIPPKVSKICLKLIYV